MLTSLNKLLGITSVGLWRDLCRTGIIFFYVFSRISQWSLWTWGFLCGEVFDINLISSTDTGCLFLYLWMNLSFKKSELLNIDKGIHSICRIPFIYNSVIFIVSFFLRWIYLEVYQMYFSYQRIGVWFLFLYCYF